MSEFNPIDIIEKHIDIIDQNKFMDLYDILEVDIPANRKSIIGEITKTLENAGINPLEYLDYIPNYYNAYRDDLKGDIYLPDNIKYIGTSAFSFCQNITLINLPESVDTIYPQAFAACTQLQYINFPSQLRIIGSRAFFNCSKLRKEDNWFQEGIEKIGGSAFWGTKIQEVTMPLSLKQLGVDPFGKNPDFTVNLHKGATLFQPYANMHIKYID